MRVCIYNLLLLLALNHEVPGQILTISPVKTLTLSTKPNCNKVFEGIHGISGIEYIPQIREWIFVGDRTYKDPGSKKELKNYFRLDNNFQLIDSVSIPENSFEAIRYDSISKSYFYSVEVGNNSYAKRSGKITFDKNDSIIIREEGHTYNNGLEALAISKSYLWTALERGNNNYASTGKLSLKRYTRDSVSKKFITNTHKPFTYKIDDWKTTCSSETIGISEMIAIDDNRLLILERCFPKSSTTNIAYARIRQVSINHDKQEIKTDTTFTFPDNPVDNMEGMAWWINPITNRRMLAVISDDNPQLSNKCQKTILTLFEVSEKP